jgi:hypothetical protein
VYLQALFQLFTGIYTMQICVLGLFLLARDSNGKFSCIPHSVIMGCLLWLTAVCHYQLRVKFSLLALSCTQDGRPSVRSSSSQSSEVLTKAATPALGCLWLPKDDYGFCDNEMSWLNSIAPEVWVTSKHAAITKEGFLKCSRPLELTEESMLLAPQLTGSHTE